MMDTADKGRSGPPRIVIAEDHPLFRSALRQTLSRQSDLEMVGEAADGQDAMELCRRFKPDLVLMDVRMPEMDGLEATRAIKREFPGIIVLILTAHENLNYLSKALKAGASGYVLKEASSGQITDAIRRALAGESPLNQELAVRLLKRLIDEAPEEEAADPAPGKPPEELPEASLLESLSGREAEVLRLIARGQTNQEIAQNLLISVSTAKKHVRTIISKLGVSDRTQAAIRALELGVLADPEEG